MKIHFYLHRTLIYLFSFNDSLFKSQEKFSLRFSPLPVDHMTCYSTLDGHPSWVDHPSELNSSMLWPWRTDHAAPHNRLHRFYFYLSTQTALINPNVYRFLPGCNPLNKKKKLAKGQMGTPNDAHRYRELVSWYYFFMSKKPLQGCISYFYN